MQDENHAGGRTLRWKIVDKYYSGGATGGEGVGEVLGKFCLGL